MLQTRAAYESGSDLFKDTTSEEHTSVDSVTAERHLKPLAYVLHFLLYAIVHDASENNKNGRDMS